MRYEPLKPKEGNWDSIPMPAQEGTMYRSVLGIQVISSVHLIYGKPEYHISISDGGQRCAASLVPIILKRHDHWLDWLHTTSILIRLVGHDQGARTSADIFILPKFLSASERQCAVAWNLH